MVLFNDSLFMLGFLKRWLKIDEKRSAEIIFRDEWREILRHNVFYYHLLPSDKQTRLEQLVISFLSEKSFEGAGGLRVTDEMCVTIAAQACILILNREGEVYPGLRTIILYPAAFVSETRRYEGGVMHEGRQVRLGESWDRGILILPWSDSLRGGLGGGDGSNLVFHEFAHQLDNEWLFGTGVPDLGKKELYERWSRVMNREFGEHVRRVSSGEPTVIHPYGATNPAEFFAVLTELFFEQPNQLQAAHIEAYQLLKEYYRQDPALLFPEEPLS